MLRVPGAGGQALLLAPTEILAQQHYATLSALLERLPAAARRKLAGGASAADEEGAPKRGRAARGAAVRAGLLVGSTKVRVPPLLPAPRAWWRDRKHRSSEKPGT